MAKPKKKNGKGKVDKSFEEKLWEAAEKLRGPLESAQYKYVVLGLLFFKFASDIYQDRRNFLVKETKNTENKEYYQKTSEVREYIINDPDEYHKVSSVFIKEGNTWKDLMKTASQENLGIKIDKMLNEIEMHNPVLQGVMPKIYAEIGLPNLNLSELINLFSTVKYGETRAADFDILGRTYEFFLSKFSSKEDTNAGEFYTPNGIVKLITQILMPKTGKVYDPTCGSGGMIVQSMKFQNEYKENSKNNLSFYGQEFKEGIWQLCKMNLILRGIDTSNIRQGDSLINDKHTDLKANFIMANPPFNMKEWGYNQLKTDKRWSYGLPTYSKQGGNFAFMQHMLYHLDKKNGRMGLVLANGTMKATGDEGVIKENIIKADLIDCMIALPKKLFFTIPHPVCIWFFNKNKNEQKKDKILFIDARKTFTKVDRIHNELSKKEIEQISSTYHSYIGTKNFPEYHDIRGYCYVATVEEIKKENSSLSPGRYTGYDDDDDDEQLTEHKMKSLIEEYFELSEKNSKLEQEMRENFLNLDYDAVKK